MTNLIVNNVEKEALLGLEELGFLGGKLPSGVRQLIVQYAANISLTKKDSPFQLRIFQDFLKYFKSCPEFSCGTYSYFNLNDQPLDQCAARARDVFFDASCLALIEEIQPEMHKLATQGLSEMELVPTVMRAAKRSVTSNFEYFFQEIARQNSAARLFYSTQHPIAECRDWLKKEGPKIRSLTLLGRLISNEALQTFPTELGCFTKLTKLDIRCNRIRALPSIIGSCSELEELNARSNEMVRISPAIGKLTKLKILELDQNALEGLPEELGNLKSLELLDLMFNGKIEGNHAALSWGVTFPPPARPHWYSLKKEEQPPKLPPYLQKLADQGCVIKIL